MSYKVATLNNQQVDLGEVNGDAEERETPTEAGIGGLMSVPARSSIPPTVNLMALSGCRTLMIDCEVFINDQSLLSLFIEDTPNDIDHVVIEHGQHQILIRIAGDGHPMFNFSNGYRQIEELVDQYGAAMFCFLNFEFGKIHILVFDVCGLEVMKEGSPSPLAASTAVTSSPEKQGRTRVLLLYAEGRRSDEELVHVADRRAPCYCRSFTGGEGLELWLNSLGIQKDDLIIFRHVGCFNFHVFVIRNKHQVALPEVHGNALDREPIDDEDGIFVPAMLSINPDVGLATLSGCRTLLIDFEEFCNDQSTLTNFIYWTDSHGDSVDIIHGQFTITFTCAGPDSINYAEQYGFLHRILWNPNNVPGKLVFFNCEIGEVHVIVFDRCGLEILANHLHGYTITDYANVETFL
nr:hypothetical protein Iba_chr02fCG9680 [Ipomoea batatas]